MNAAIRTVLLETFATV